MANTALKQCNFFFKSKKIPTDMFKKKKLLYNFVLLKFEI